VAREVGRREGQAAADARTSSMEKVTWQTICSLSLALISSKSFSHVTGTIPWRDVE
jgi:hypothetical protein